MQWTDDEKQALAPTGVLRATINLGNPILAKAPAQPGDAPSGISVDLARSLAQLLDLELQLQVLDTADKAVQAVSAHSADIGFFAIDPKRAEGIAFTAPYVLIEGAYLVQDDSAITTHEQVDVPGVRVTVGLGSAYDLFLSRALQHAQIARAPTSPAVVDYYLEHQLEVAAGVRQQLEHDAQRLGGLRLLPGRFMVIEQAMGLPIARGPAAAALLRRFVDHAKASGLVAQAMQLHRVQGARIAE